MKKWVAALAVAGMLLVSGCDTGEGTGGGTLEADKKTAQKAKKMPKGSEIIWVPFEGEKVPCVYIVHNDNPALDCLWTYSTSGKP